MIGFLSPLSLLFAALSIPIIVLYMLKMRRRDRTVSSTLLWRRLLRDVEANAPWQRLRPNLLMLLQLLALALLTLALARPFAPAPFAVGGNVVVLLDASASMQATDAPPSRFGAAVRAARGLVDRLGASDTMTIIAVGPTPQVLASATNDRTLLRRALDAATPTNGPADWEAAFALAAAGLGGSPDAQTVIISDGALPQTLPALPGEVRFIGVGSSATNLAISALAIREDAAGLQAFLRVVNYGSADASPLVEFYADGRLFDARRLSVQPRSSAALVLSDLPYDLRVLEARLTPGDALALDDAAWAVRPSSGPGRVLLISRGNLFLERALAVLPGVELTRLSPDQPLPSEAYDLYVCDGVVTGTLPTGNVWLVGPPASVSLGDGFQIAVGGVVTPAAISRVAADDPLLRYVDLSAVHIMRARAVEPPPGARRLVEVGDVPLFFVAERPEGRLAVLTFDLHDSDLPLQIAFPILTANLVNWLLPRQAMQVPDVVRPGDSVAIQAVPGAAEVRVAAPDGSLQTFPVGEQTLVLPADQLGVYAVAQLAADDSLLQSAAFAVNLFDEDESDIAPRETVRVGQVEVAAGGRGEKGRRELWPWGAGAGLMALLIEWAVYWRGRTARGWPWAAVVLRGVIVASVVLGLAGVQLAYGGDELAVVFLVDVSDSVPAAEQERALAFIEEALAALGPDDRAAVIVFGSDALVERPMVGGGALGEIASIPRTNQTDLEEAVRLGMALLPSGAARRMVILSDGRPTVGRAEQVVRLAQAQGIQVDVVPLNSLLSGGEERAEAWLSELSAPGRLHPGEEFTLSVAIQSTRDTDATLTILAGDVVVLQGRVHLNPGDNTFAVPLTAGEPGFASFRAYLAPVSDVYVQNNALSAFSLVVGPPRVLVVAPEAGPGEQDEGTHLRAALRAAGLEVDSTLPSSLPVEPAGLAEYAAVVLVNTPARSLQSRAMEALQQYVRDLGGGLVAVGGPNAYGVGGWYNTLLEETLPVEMTLYDPQRFPPMAIVVVIDKSGSMTVMEGGVQKIRLAGEAAARVAELITDLDEITVIAFDDRPADVIGPLPGAQRDEVIDRVIRLQAGGGGIYVRESLEEALRYLEGSEKSVRHIILLADGSDSEHQEGVPALVTDRIAGQGITLSTVAIGAGQDLAFLEGIAALGNGRYYFTGRAADLPVIFAEETQMAMRSYVVEEPFYPRLVSSSPMLAGIEATPQLAGYVATTPKPAGQVILATGQDDPLLAVWQYGLGRSVAWTSDATSRWARRWISWEGFVRLWSQIVRWTIVEQADAPVEVTVAQAGEEARIVVEAASEDGTLLNGLDGHISIVAPDGDPTLVELVQTAPGYYEGTFAPQEEGVYVMRLAASSPEGEEITLLSGWVMGYSPEYAVLESDPAYLAGLAELGGGSVLTAPAEALTHDLRGVGVRQALWPYLLGLAAALLPFDVAVRRLALGRREMAQAWSRIRARLRRRRRGRGEAPSQVTRLFEAKSRVEKRHLVEPPAAAGQATLGETPPPAAPPKKPVPPYPSAPQSAAEGETLASQLLKKKRGGMR